MIQLYRNIVVWFMLFTILLIFSGGCASSADPVDSKNSSQDIAATPTGPDTDEAETTNNSEVIQPDDEEIIKLVQQAHSLALEVFMTAFEAEVAGSSPQPWSEVRPVLLQHFSMRMVDDNFADFYKNSLSDWGYEMIFAFPLAEKDMIISLNVDKRTPQSVSIIAVTLTGYDELDTITHTLIEENGHWVIDY